MNTNERHKGLRDFIVANETRKGQAGYLPPKDIALKFGCSIQYVYRVRYLLGMKNAPSQPKTPTISLDHEVDESGALQQLIDEPLIGPLDRLKVLSRLIRVGAPAVKIQAIKAYEELTRSSDSLIGPGAPLTDEDRVARLARLLMAVGSTTASKAWEVAFGVKSPSYATKTPLQPVSHPPSEAPKPQPESLYDLSELSFPPPSPSG